MQVLEGWSPYDELRGPRLGVLNISMVEYNGFMLVTFARIGKWPWEAKLLKLHSMGANQTRQVRPHVGHIAKKCIFLGGIQKLVWMFCL